MENGVKKKVWVSSPVVIALKMKPELEDSFLVRATESLLVPEFPLAFNDLEGNVLVRGTCVESKNFKGWLSWHILKCERWRRGFINEIGVKYIEFVSLHNLWGRVLRIVVGLIVLIPLVSLQI